MREVHALVPAAVSHALPPPRTLHQDAPHCFGRRGEKVPTTVELLRLIAVHEPQAADVVKLRYFAGLTAEQAADSLGISLRTANRHWAYAKAWLYRQLSDGGLRPAQLSPETGR